MKIYLIKVIYADGSSDFIGATPSLELATQKQDELAACRNVLELTKAGDFIFRGDPTGFELLELRQLQGANPLSKREFEIAQGLARGAAPKAIAADLGLSPKTVSTYQARVQAKLGLASFRDIAVEMHVRGLA